MVQWEIVSDIKSALTFVAPILIDAATFQDLCNNFGEYNAIIADD